MGLITLRPFPHPTIVGWRYFHSSNYRFYINPGSGITTTSDNFLWNKVTVPTIDQTYPPFRTVGFAYTNNSLVYAHNFIDSKVTTLVTSRQSLVYQSFGGEIWDATTPAETYCTDVVAGNNIFVAVTSPTDSKDISLTMIATSSAWKPISTSTDGFNWFEQQVTVAIEDQFDQVLFDGTEFKAIGNASILRSTDGLNWVQQQVTFPPTYFTSIELNSITGSEQLYNPTYSKMVYGDGKYVYNTIDPVPIGSNASSLLNISFVAGSGTVVNNVSSTGEWLVTATGMNTYSVIRINNSSYTNVVVKITLETDSMDYLDSTELGQLTYSRSVYHDRISGQNKRYKFVVVAGGDFHQEDVTIRTQYFGSGLSNPTKVHIQAYPSYRYNLVSYSTSDFVTFTKSSPIVLDVRPNYYRIKAFGYSVDRWVLWVNTYIVEDNTTYDYVVYSLNGTTWTRANSLSYARVNNTNPGHAELYPGFATNLSIETTYQIGYQGGAIMTSADGNNWTAWIPTEMIIQ